MMEEDKEIVGNVMSRNLTLSTRELLEIAILCAANLKDLLASKARAPSSCF